MKLWQWAALLVGVGIVYVLVKRPSLPSGGIYPSSRNSTDNTLSQLLAFGIKLTDKIGAPSAVTSTPNLSFDDIPNNVGRYGTNTDASGLDHDYVTDA